MSSWPIRPQALLRVTLAFVTTVFPLLAIAMGGMDLLTWVHIHRGNQYYYVEYWSLVHARWFLLVGMIGVLPPRAGPLPATGSPAVAMALNAHPAFPDLVSEHDFVRGGGGTPQRTLAIPHATKSSNSSLTLLSR